MKEQPLGHWLAAGVLGMTLIVGCNEAPRRTVSYTPPRTPAMVTMPAPAPPVTAMPAPPPAVVRPPELSPVVMQDERNPAVEEKGHERVAVEEKEKPILPAQNAVPLTGSGEEPVKRRTFNDITASPEFNHSGDYTSLTGELQYVHVRKTWCVRYASVDEEDSYGGKVTLIETGPMNGYSDGQIVRVEGQLVNPESKEPCPAFRVRSIQPVSHQ